MSEGLLPGHCAGFHCEICAEPLQLSPDGMAIVAESPQSQLLCNECGLIYVQLSKEAGCLAVAMSPSAKAQLESDNASPLAQFVRKLIV